MTYSLPSRVADELDRRTASSGRSKSTLVAQALEQFFAAEDEQTLGRLYAEAARDPLFVADNEEVLRDFAALDAELDALETTE